MTLVEFVDKLIKLKNESKNANKPIKIFIEDEFNNIDFNIETIEVENDGIYLS